MAKDGRRTLLVLGDQADLFLALRPYLNSVMLQVRWCSSAVSEITLKECAPWPWGIAGAGPDAPGEAFSQLVGKPVLWFWLGDRPAVAPAHTRTRQRWREMVVDVRACISRSVGGVRLAPNRGLLTLEGDLVLSSALEALVSSNPVALRMSSKYVRAAQGAITRHHLSVQLSRDRGQTGVEARA